MKKRNLLLILPLLFGLASCFGDDTTIPQENCSHEWSTQWTVDETPTCTTAGSKSHHCLLCDAKSDVTEIPALGHDFGSWYIYRDPTCKQPGEERRDCSRCDDYESRPIARIDHKLENPVYYWNTEYTELTGMAKCTECGQTITETVGSTRKMISGSCTTGGTAKVTSNKFENSVFTIQEKIITVTAGNHDWSNTWTVDKEATCTEDGSKSHHCNNCGDKKDITTIPALGHAYGDWLITKEPTLEAPGEKTKTCDRCGEKITEVIPKLSKYKFDSFKQSLNVSKPTKIETNMVYTIEKLALSLNNKSTLTVQYGDEIKAKYEYSKQKLNPIGSDELITTTTGVSYAKGNSVGELDNGSIKWNESTESSLSFLNVNFEETILGEYVIDDNKLSSTIADDKVEEFFGTAYNITEVNIEISVNEGQTNTLSSIKLSYKDVKTGALINTVINYTYANETVEIPA